jgi:hypothetical protein
MRFATWSRILVLTAATVPFAAHAITYNEASNGDLSNVGTSPTFIGLTSGANQVIGTTGNPGTGTDRDYFTVTIGPGQQLTSLKVLAGTVPLGLAFLGLQAGNQVTVSPTSGSAAGLLGWAHYATADVGNNILPRMGTGAGASGFVGSLPAGNYSFWIQDFNAGASTYALELTVAAVPEPAAALSLLAGLAALLAIKRARHTQRR